MPRDSAPQLPPLPPRAHAALVALAKAMARDAARADFKARHEQVDADSASEATETA